MPLGYILYHHLCFQLLPKGIWIKPIVKDMLIAYSTDEGTLNKAGWKEEFVSWTVLLYYETACTHMHMWAHTYQALSDHEHTAACAHDETYHIMSAHAHTHAQSAIGSWTRHPLHKQRRGAGGATQRGRTRPCAYTHKRIKRDLSDHWLHLVITYIRIFAFLMM